jgi:polyisoprenoid-binding protein YceI
MKRVLAVLALVAFAGCSQPASDRAPSGAQTQSSAAPAVADVPAGAYRLDKTHASLTFRVSHMGFSNYTARFKRFDAELRLDPANPAASSVTATIDPRSIETDFPTPQTVDFNAELQGPQWLDAARFPEITFRSTRVELTGRNTARVTGDFSLHGVTRPVVLDATFNGGYRGHPTYDPNARIGFSARGTIKRSEYGIAYGVLQPGSNMGVGDDVEVIIETEFTGPPLPAAPK